MHLAVACRPRGVDPAILPRERQSNIPPVFMPPLRGGDLGKTDSGIGTWDLASETWDPKQFQTSNIKFKTRE